MPQVIPGCRNCTGTGGFTGNSLGVMIGTMTLHQKVGVSDKQKTKQPLRGSLEKQILLKANSGVFEVCLFLPWNRVNLEESFGRKGGSGKLDIGGKKSKNSTVFSLQKSDGK